MRSTVPLGVSRTEVDGLIEEYCLNQKYRQILKRRFLDEIRFEPLAEEFDMSVRQVKHIVYKYGDVVLSHISF